MNNINFRDYCGGIKQLLDSDPTHPYYVINATPNKNSSTFCIKTKEGWVVFTKEYGKDLIYPTSYGILNRLLDMEGYCEAMTYGIAFEKIKPLLDME